MTRQRIVELPLEAVTQMNSRLINGERSTMNNIFYIIGVIVVIVVVLKVLGLY